jgi:hypothetical protein
VSIEFFAFSATFEMNSLFVNQSKNVELIESDLLFGEELNSLSGTLIVGSFGFDVNS